MYLHTKQYNTGYLQISKSQNESSNKGGKKTLKKRLAQKGSKIQFIHWFV